MVQDCVFKVSSYANWVCDCQAAIGEHIALCDCDAANRAAEAKEQNGHIPQQAKCAMLPCLGYLEAECENCVKYNLYRKP